MDKQGSSRVIVYTFGYSGHSITDLERHIERLGAVVVDIRHSPSARNATWRKHALENRLGLKYEWVGELGNVNYRGGDIKISDLPTGTRKVHNLIESRPVILMCVCKDPEWCHRKVVAEHLSNVLGADVIHLGKPEDRQMGLFPEMKQGKMF